MPRTPLLPATPLVAAQPPPLRLRPPTLPPRKPLRSCSQTCPPSGGATEDSSQRLHPALCVVHSYRAVCRWQWVRLNSRSHLLLQRRFHERLSSRNRHWQQRPAAACQRQPPPRLQRRFPAGNRHWPRTEPTKSRGHSWSTVVSGPRRPNLLRFMRSRLSSRSTVSVASRAGDSSTTPERLAASVVLRPCATSWTRF